MKNDTLLLLVTSQDVNPNHTQYVTHGEERIQQYINGIKKLFEYDFNNKADVMICDNTTNHLDKRIIDVLPWDTLYLTYENNMGATSKSRGLYHQWKSCLEEINKYEWIIHFEPRQILKKHDFFDSFFKNKRNLFNVRGDHFWTGLFSMKASLLSKFLEESLVTGSESIEYIMFRFMKQHEYEHEELNLLWNEVGNNRWIDI